jgi:glycerophosphoryl diester phosphodiesterase
MVELDVQMTREGRLVVFHDERLERTTDGRGALRGTRYAHLARLDHGSWFGLQFAGQRILLVSQAARLVPRSMGINLELKRTTARRALVRRLTRLVSRWRLASRLLISSFDPRLLKLLTDASLARALICRRDPDRSLRQAIRLGCVAWHPLHSLVTRRRIAQAHAAGLRVHAWTIDDISLARRLVGWGVEGLFTNDPARLRILRRR